MHSFELLNDVSLRKYLSIFIYRTKKELLNVRGITEAKAEKIFEAAGKIERMNFQSGMAILEKRKKIRRISTGSPSFDMLLRGGIES